MSLRDLVVEPKTVKFGNGEVTLYPITLRDVILLSKEFAPELGSLMNGEQVDVPRLITQSPLFVSSLVSHSAREPDAVDLVAALPFSVQLIALQTIWDLSAVDGDLLGKFVLRLSEGIAKLNSQLKERNLELMKQSAESLGKPT